MLDPKSKQILLISLSEFKMVYGLYDPLADSLMLEDPTVIDLDQLPPFPDYSLDRNELMQIEALGCVSYTNGTGKTVRISAVLTTAYSEHFKVELFLYLDSTSKVKGQQILLKQVLRGYGYFDILNWASSTDNQFIVAYRGDGTVTFAWYNLSEQ